MNRANEISTVKDGAREIALKKLREIKERNLEGASNATVKAKRDRARTEFARLFR